MQKLLGENSVEYAMNFIDILPVMNNLLICLHLNFLDYLFTMIMMCQYCIVSYEGLILGRRYLFHAS